MHQIKIQVQRGTYCDVCSKGSGALKARIECKTDAINKQERVDTVIDICNDCAKFIGSLTTGQ